MIDPKRIALLTLTGSAAIAGGIVVTLHGLDQDHQQRTQVAPGAAFAQATLPPPNPDKLKANELGRIPIVMYHSIDEPHTKYDAHGLNIHGETFRKHLTMMAKAGWYPMNARDLYLPEKLQSVPAGMTPVALTFDDARGSQFRYLKDGSIDPNCVVGILEAYHQKYGEKWPRAGTFFALPKSSYNPTPFWQVGLEKKKCQWLVANGYELSNHSFAHHFMTKMSAQQVREAVWGCVRDIRKLAPEATMDTFCVPYGAYPKDKSTWPIILNDPQGKYKNLVAFKAWGDESYAPLDKRFDPKIVDRIGVDNGYFEHVFARLEKGGKLYISDGNPETVSIPRSWEAFVSKERLQGSKLVVYGPPTKANVAKKVLPTKPKTKVVKKPTA